MKCAHFVKSSPRNASRLPFLLRSCLDRGLEKYGERELVTPECSAMLFVEEQFPCIYIYTHSLCRGTWQIICCMCNEVVTKYDLQPQEQTNESFLCLKWQWNYGGELTDQKNVISFCYNLICGSTKFVVTTMDIWMDWSVRSNKARNCCKIQLRTMFNNIKLLFCSSS